MAATYKAHEASIIQALNVKRSFASRSTKRGWQRQREREREKEREGGGEWGRGGEGRQGERSCFYLKLKTRLLKRSDDVPGCK